jgi:hypothetical protein
MTSRTPIRLHSSSMTFSEFLISMFSENEFPYDKSMEFESSTQGGEIGNLLLSLITRAGCTSEDYPSDQSDPDGFLGSYSHKTFRLEKLNGSLVQVVMKVWRPDYHGMPPELEPERRLFFPPHCKIEIECTGFPF